jgi:hypothetical protein
MPTQASTATGTSYQNASTFLFVPSSAGATRRVADDVNTPGAYFRLGGFSDIENTATDRSVFYPRQHITDEGSGAVTAAAGKTASMKGIMFACSGRILLRSAEKIYVHSSDAIHVDTEKALTVLSGDAVTVTAAKTITMTSGSQQNITISAGAGTGTVTTKSLKNVKEVNGNEYEYITQDSFKYYKCNIYTYKLGGMVDVTMGGAFAFWMGNKLTITVSIDMQISLATTFAFWYFKFDMGVVKMDFYKTKMEFKDGKFSLAAWKGGNYGAACVSALAKTGAHGVKSGVQTVSSATSSVMSGLEAVGTMSGGVKMYTMGLMGFN